MKISKSAATQYFWIYLMLIVPGSVLFAKYLSGNAKHIILLFIYSLSMLYNKKYVKSYTVIFVGLLFFMIGFVRIKTGNGVGITSWYQFAVCLLSASAAISCDAEKFFTRWIRAVVFFASISIIFWAIFTLVPELVDLWPAESYKVETIGSVGYEKIRYGKGLLLYSYIQAHPKRNCGIYTEPGVYEIVLNAALYVLLFWKEKIQYKKENSYKKHLLIIFLAIITCQSTTGYISLLLILCFYIFFEKRKPGEANIRVYVILIAIGAIMGILIEYNINGTESILYKQVIKKMFAGDVSSGVVLSEGSAGARYGTIVVSLQAIAKDPFGIGFVEFYAMRDAFGNRLVGASFLSFLAVYGLIPWLAMVLAVFYPVYKYEKTRNAVLFTLIFINTTLAQTDLLYPALMMIPMHLLFDSTKRVGIYVTHDQK